MSPNLAPERLIALAARGNGPAFERLADELTGPILPVVGHVVSDRGQAEELTRRVLVELWRTASRYREADGSEPRPAAAESGPAGRAGARETPARFAGARGTE
ncbi:hypothetical protein [Amycolatopsis sp. RTGN1]|uniref:hypothetical protein n=1 Tax=Amycolatopsis ponsaeliensis TaxID=2992142 RepID=UPI00254E7E57|nr:hypothetical protein [Amycolatopsis sp. RTGN1]